MTAATRTILLVDDDVDLTTQLQVLLEAAGFTVAVAHSEKEGGQVLAEVDPDLVVVDLMMEENDSGFTFCHHAKAQRPDLPVILLTAVTSETGIAFDAATEEERSWIKADAFLDKPVRFERLQAEITRLLGAPA